MPLRPRRTASLNGFFQALKDACVWQYVFETSRGRCGSFETGCHWYNHERLMRRLGLKPPAEAEAAYWASQAA